MTEPAQPLWITEFAPVSESRIATIAAAPVAGLAAVLDVDPTTVSVGCRLPALWHWAALAEWASGSTIGPDGHPTTGGFMPATPFPRRMWIGTRVEITEPPTIGNPVTVARVVSEVSEKTGRTGSFAVATVRTSVTSEGGALLLNEHTTFAYRPAATEPTTAHSSESTPIGGNQPWLAQTGEWAWTFQPGPVTLMMFSAATANAHRIHYDTPYAQGAEGYPNLLVHGPLMAVILAEVARRETPDREIRGFECRAQRPMFLGSAAVARRIDHTAVADSLRLALDPIANPASADAASAFMTATVTYR